MGTYQCERRLPKYRSLPQQLMMIEDDIPGFRALPNNCYIICVPADLSGIPDLMRRPFPMYKTRKIKHVFLLQKGMLTIFLFFSKWMANLCFVAKMVLVQYYAYIPRVRQKSSISIHGMRGMCLVVPPSIFAEYWLWSYCVASRPSSL